MCNILISGVPHQLLLQLLQLADLEIMLQVQCLPWSATQWENYRSWPRRGSGPHPSMTSPVSRGLLMPANSSALSGCGSSQSKVRILFVQIPRTFQLTDKGPPPNLIWSVSLWVNIKTPWKDDEAVFLTCDIILLVGFNTRTLID